MPGTLTREVIAALKAYERTWSFAYDVLDGSGRYLRSVDVESCSVQNNDLADKAKRTCTVKFAASSSFDQLSELFRPRVLLKLAGGTMQEWTIGTFLLSSSTKSSASTAGERGRAYSGWDRLLIIDEDKMTDRWVEASGTNVVSAVVNHLNNHGFPVVTATASTKTLPAAMEWEPGTPILTIVNDLLASIGYRSLYVDEYGVPIVEPYVDPSSVTPRWSYAADAESVIAPGIDTTLDLFNVPNKWIAYVSEPDRPVLTSTYTNANPASPTSTVSRGRTIVDVIQMTQATGDAPPVDQATLDARVLRAAQEASQAWEDVEFTTGLMPFHGTGDVFTLDDGRGPLTYREHTWEMELRAGGLMKHRFRRVVAL